MANNILSTVLASSVVAGIISATIAYFQFHKNNKLVYITNERKEWRSDIRKIAKEIEAADTYKVIRKPLTELKVRINTYGKYSDDYNKDAHIWKVIDQLQRQEGDFEELKELLILYLSMLLKMDWERSKEEIRGNTYKTVLYLMVFLTGISYSYIYLVAMKLSVDLLFIVSEILILLPIIVPERKRMNLKLATDWFGEAVNEFLDGVAKTIGICMLLFVVSIVIECCIGGVWMRAGEFLIPMSLLVCTFFVRYLYEYRRYALDVYYYQNIALCKVANRNIDEDSEMEK